MTGGLDTCERPALEELRDVVRFDAQELCDLTDSKPEALLSPSHDNVISVPKWGRRYSGDGGQRRSLTPAKPRAGSAVTATVEIFASVGSPPRPAALNAAAVSGQRRSQARRSRDPGKRSVSIAHTAPRRERRSAEAFQGVRSH
jgi:hypothetical protein